MTWTSRISRAVTLTSLAVLCFPPSRSIADTLVMPRDLVTYAKKQGCSPPDDIFERTGLVGPPYLLGLFPGEPEDSVAFWCTKAKPDSKPFLLLLKVSDPKTLNGCPDRIEWWNPPAGLSVERRTRMSLNNFRSTANNKPPRPPAVLEHATVIIDSVDGLRSEFVCYGREWFVRMFD
jgi:hypothetical protein